MRSLKAALTVALVLAATIGSPALGATPARFLSIAHGRAILVAKAIPGSPTPFYRFDRCHRSTCRLLAFGAPTWTLDECYKPNRATVQCQLGEFKADDPQAVLYATLTASLARGGGARTYIEINLPNS